MDATQTEKILHMLHIFTADLILQVFGGAGAIWGFSEVLGLRTPETVWFWRPVAQFVGAVFFARWVLQLDAHVKEQNIGLFPCKNDKHQKKVGLAINIEEQTVLCDDSFNALSPASGISMPETGKDYESCE